MKQPYDEGRFNELLESISRKAVAVSRLDDGIDEAIGEIKAMGLVRLLLGEPFGGHGASMQEASKVIARMAEACGSTAWCYGLFVSHGIMLSAFPAVTRELVLSGNADAMLATGLCPEGTASLYKNRDGYSVAGKWHYVSAVSLADWVALMSELPGGEPAWVLLKPSELVVDRDSWQVAGLAGTQTWNVEACVNGIDEACVVPQSALQYSTGPDAARSIPMPVIVPAIGASIAIGLSRQALRQMSRRVLGFPRDAQRIESACQFAELELRVTACEALLDNMVKDIEQALAGEVADLQLLASRTRGEAAFIINGCFDSVSAMTRYMGTQSLDLDQRFQLCLRDLAAIQTHYYVNKSESYLDYALAYALGERDS